MSVKASLASDPAASQSDRFVDRQQIARDSTTLQTMVRNDPGAVGLYYVVTDDKLSIIIATARSSFGRQVSVGEVELNRQIEAFRKALADPLIDPRPAARMCGMTAWAIKK